MLSSCLFFFPCLFVYTDRTKAIRKIISPNSGFVKQLIQYEFELFGKNSVSATAYPYLELDALVGD